MKLLMVVVHLSYGGAETQVINLSKELKYRGWEVKVVSMMNPSAWVEELNNHGIDVVSLGFKRGIPSFRGLLKYLKIIKEYKPHVVHAHTYNPNIMTRIAKLFTPKHKLVCTPHNSIEGGFFRTIAYRLTDFLADMNTNVSNASVKAYISKGATPTSKMKLIYNGLTTKEHEVSEYDVQKYKTELNCGSKFIWVTVGRLTKQKNFSWLIITFSQLIKIKPDSLLLIIGEGEEENMLKNLVKELSLDKHIIFLGARKDVLNLLKIADSFVLSSLWEGLPMVLLEAAVCKLPAVVTDVDGNCEIYQDRYSGFLVNPKINDSLLLAMHKLQELTNDELENLGSNAYRYVSNTFDINKIVTDWEKLYKEI